MIHLASIPLVMGFQKLRHLMEQFGEVGRVYLAPEATGQWETKRDGWLFVVPLILVRLLFLFVVVFVSFGLPCWQMQW